MSTLLGTQKNPSLVRDDLGQLDLSQDGKDRELEEIQERYASWIAFKKTSLFDTLTSLSEPYLTRLNEDLAKSVMILKQSYPAYSLEELQELRAEWRGELMWWKMLLFGPGIMERRLNELEAYRRKRETGKEDSVLPDKIKKFV